METNVDSAEIIKFGQYASEWWSKEGPLRTLHDINPTRLNYIESFTSLKHQRVLDIGCGGGILAEGMAERGAKVTGLDLAPEAIAVAKEHAELHHLTIDYQCQSIDAFHAEQFPIITCLEMLEHVPDPECIVREAARLLAPGGY
ncbi:MAG TPA: bifunctional 2-polyprenyl-6-hydroxyphenol methylase/3-demethylubiquinol 3-O-methyltransferase UbiG, partial [Legionellaceae bacterium]|nr:bifunctional 2-polyprenyl-6-hydroxyphenol methylase/3-demethylubiquinol 3-O-methyltransferase UbiG [Legionellaceae bacterium]